MVGENDGLAVVLTHGGLQWQRAGQTEDGNGCLEMHQAAVGVLGTRRGVGVRDVVGWHGEGARKVRGPEWRKDGRGLLRHKQPAAEGESQQWTRS